LFHEPPTPELSPLSLHDALPILVRPPRSRANSPDGMVISTVAGESNSSTSSARLSTARRRRRAAGPVSSNAIREPSGACAPLTRSEEHTSELQSLTNLVCRLLLE